MTETITDAEIVHDDEPGTALVPAPRRTSEVLRPLDLAQQKEAMAAYQRGLREILDDSDWQDAGRGERFVKKSGWRKIAAWFDLSIELVRDEVERAEDGTITRAAVCARAVAPSGRFADGDGYCDASESRFNRNRQKLENDLRGTATTRAVNRAISNLVGMGAVSAEEIDAPTQQSLPYGQPYDKDAMGKLTGAACVQLCHGDKDLGIALFKAITKDCGGYMPAAAAIAIIHCAEGANRQPDVEAPEVA